MYETTDDLIARAKEIAEGLDPADQHAASTAALALASIAIAQELCQQPRLISRTSPSLLRGCMDALWFLKTGEKEGASRAEMIGILTDAIAAAKVGK